VDAGRKARLAGNLAAVRERIAVAATGAGRDPAAVTLVAVTKYVDAEAIAALLALGVTDLGESRPQRLWELAPRFPQARWHLIGPLQTNKVRRTLPLVHTLHSLDREELATAIAAEAPRLPHPCRAFVQLKLADASNKGGVPAHRAKDAIDRWLALPGLDLQGLMAMAEPEWDFATLQASFQALRKSSALLPPERRRLSMGMSGDYEIAIAEGATHVRVGSALFEGLA
jgi:hypothetical protein